MFRVLLRTAFGKLLLRVRLVAGVRRHCLFQSRDHIADKIQDLGQGNKPVVVSYNQSFLSSTSDSAESIATPQEADLDDEQIRALPAPPRYLPEREASAERSQIYHSEKEGLMSSASQSLNVLTCGMALTSGKIGSRRIFRKRATL